MISLIVAGALTTVFTILSVGAAIQFRQVRFQASIYRKKNLTKARASRGEFDQAKEKLKDAQERPKKIEVALAAERHKKLLSADQGRRTQLEIPLKKDDLFAKLDTLVELGVLNDSYELANASGLSVMSRTGLANVLDELQILMGDSSFEEMTGPHLTAVRSAVARERAANAANRSTQAGSATQGAPVAPDGAPTNIRQAVSASGGSASPAPGQRNWVQEARARNSAPTTRGNTS